MNARFQTVKKLVLTGKERESPALRTGTITAASPRKVFATAFTSPAILVGHASRPQTAANMVLRDRISTLMKQRRPDTAGAGCRSRHVAPHACGLARSGKDSTRTLGPLLDMLEECPTVARPPASEPRKEASTRPAFPARDTRGRLNDPPTRKAIAEARARNEVNCIA